MNTKSTAQQRGSARTQRPERTQVSMRFHSLEQMVDENHRVRLVWQYCETLDLSSIYNEIKATHSNRGRTPIDPRILFCLWFFATIEGITSARRLAELTTRDFVYMWICGGVSVNHHTLSDFRSGHGELLNRLLIDSIAVLVKEGLITLESIGQDGMRVRASAGKSSFRSQPTLERLQAEAEDYLKELNERAKQGEQAATQAEQAAQEKAARERLERIKAAQENLQKLERRRKEKRSRKGKSVPRGSTTDPEAVRMKMGDGGFRPAYNVQFASDSATRIVVAMDVNNQGSDQGQMLPIYNFVCTTYEVTPENFLVDGGFTKKSDIEVLERNGTKVYGALPNVEKQIEAGKDPYAKKPGDSEAMAEFRARMGTPEAQEIYSARASIAEFPNAECRNRGLQQFRVRGIEKTTAQALWHVLVNNFHRFKNLDFLPVLMGGQSVAT